jgi:agmatinase
MKGVFNDKYMASRACDEHVPVPIVLLGCPLDATSSFRGGTKFAPDSIRKASWTLETYSPYLKRDLEGIRFCDEGNLELPQGDLERSLERIETAVAEMLGDGKRPLLFGGEHLVTYPIMKAVRKHYGHVQLVHFDAHCDLRDEYEGQKLSHATVMKRTKELGGLEMLQIGIRSGTRQEFEELEAIGSPTLLASRLKKDIPVYVSFDLDVLDPSLCPGVTTPEPGGLSFNEVLGYLAALEGARIVGADIVELAPDYDHSFVSSVAAAKVAREVIMLMDWQ